MADNIIIDTGAIVGLANRRDQYHQWCKKEAAILDYPFFTCEAVLSESFHLLKSVPNGIKLLVGLLEKDLIKVAFSYSNYAAELHQLIEKYANLPAGFADACLVQMAETTRKARIFTVDSDFNIYRLQSGKALSLISPQ